jgi:tRNA modification GTPase
LLDALAGGRADEANAATAMITQVRHRDLVERAAGELEGCLEDLAADVPPDLLAVRIRLATAHIDAITGREVGPEVLDEIFARFCIGK